MGKMEPVNVTMPIGLRDKARAHGLCVSRLATIAIQEAVRKLEPEEAGAEASKQSTPTAAHKGEAP